MKVIDSLLNRSEESVLRELQNVASDNGMRVFAKLRLSDVLQKGNTRLTEREFEFYTRSYCDFVLTDAEARPFMIVEYDGSLHQSSAKQQDAMTSRTSSVDRRRSACCVSTTATSPSSTVALSPANIN